MRISFRGFSLIEVVIALGIIAFALVAILGMFPVAIGASKDSRDDTRAAAIAQLLYGQLKSQPADRASIALGASPTNGASIFGHLPVNLTNGTTNYVAFDDEGEPLRSFTAVQYTNGALPVVGTTYKTRVSVDPNKPINGLSRVTVEVTYPALSVLSNRTTNLFVTYLNNVAP